MVDRLGLAATTDIVVAADHGFSTISKQSSTSPAAKADYRDVPKGFLPQQDSGLIYAVMQGGQDASFVEMQRLRAAFDPEGRLAAGRLPEGGSA